jgi:hypothetical protein
LAAVEFEGRWLYIDMNGRPTIDPNSKTFRGEFLGPFQSGVARVTGDRTDGMIGHSGNWVVPPGRLSILDDLKSGLAPAEIKGKYGYINSKGEWAIKPKFSFALPFEEELAAVQVGKGSQSKAGYVNAKGEWIITAKFDEARRFCSGLAPVRINDKWGYIDKNGDWIIKPIYEDGSIFDAGIASVFFRDEEKKLRHAYINIRGEILYSSKGEYSIVKLH